MNKSIPKMYKSKLDKNINNSQQVYSTLNKENITIENRNTNNEKLDKFTLNQKIYNIFNSNDYIYKADVNIVTKDGIYKKRVVGKTSTSLITFDNEYIKIEDIIDIYPIKK